MKTYTGEACIFRLSSIGHVSLIIGEGALKPRFEYTKETCLIALTVFRLQFGRSERFDGGHTKTINANIVCFDVGKHGATRYSQCGTRKAANTPSEM